MIRPFPSQSQENPDVPRWPRTADRILVVASWTAIVLLLLDILTFGYGRDQGIYAMVGRAILSGKMPYRDAWDFKPPGIFLIYAASRAVFGSAQVGIRILEVLGLLATVFAIIRLAERWWGERRIGLMAAVIAVLVHAELDFWHTAQPETFGGFLTIFALLVLGPTLFPEAPPALDSRTLGRWALSGVLFGFSGLLKPPLAGGGAVVAIALALPFLRSPGPIGSRLSRALVPALAIAAGGALPFALCFVWFGLRGALADLVEVLFVFTPHYTKLSWVNASVLGMAYDGFNEWLMVYSSATTFGLLLVLALRPKAREIPGVVLLLGIIAVHVAGVVMQAKFFPYHFGATWPLTALVAAVGFHRLWERLGTRSPAKLSLFFAIVVFTSILRTATKDLEHPFLVRAVERAMLFARPVRDQRAIDRLAVVADVSAVANRDVATFLRERVPSGRTVFVWGFEPVIYDQADRSPSTRYLYNVPQRVAWAKDRHRALLMKDLEASPPAAIVVERRDVFPMVTGDAIDSADTLRSFPELHHLLETRFSLAKTIEDFDVYLER